jgi:hypothetical protein
MSIKQNGGVFGRNPTFNDVTIEGQLTFDGDIDINSDLKVDGNLEVDGAATIDQDAAALAFKVTGGSGGVNIAEFSRDIGADTTVGINGNAASPQIYFESPSNTFAIGVSSNTFEISDNASIGTNTRLSISNTGDVSVSTGNLVIGTSGKGIDFSATSGTGTSELFDDYEEGTWTPTITGSTSGSVAGITINRAAYTKIGNQVTVYFYISAVNLDTASLVGNAEIGGLPFNSLNSFMQLAAVNYTNFFSFDESDISVGGYVHSGTKVKLLKGSSVSGIPVGELSGTAQVMMFGMTYESS